MYTHICVAYYHLLQREGAPDPLDLRGARGVVLLLLYVIIEYCIHIYIYIYIYIYTCIYTHVTIYY